MTARQQQPQGASYVIRFERGSRHDPNLAGMFLGWLGGYFTPCINRSLNFPLTPPATEP
jgi:hypothetical protein